MLANTTTTGPVSETTQVSWYQKAKTNLDFTEARDSEWQCHQPGHTQICTSLQTDNHSRTQPLSVSQAGRTACRPTNRVIAWKANNLWKCAARKWNTEQAMLPRHLWATRARVEESWRRVCEPFLREKIVRLNDNHVHRLTARPRPKLNQVRKCNTQEKLCEPTAER